MDATEPRPAIEEHDEELGGMPAHWRSAPAAGTPALYLHDAASASEDFEPFLRSRGGVAPDLPGFGRTGKPGHFPYSPEGWADWLESFLNRAGVTGEVDLVAHGWGAAGLAWAARDPDRVRRIVLLNPVPLFPGVRWRGPSRLWRRRVVGETAIGMAIKPVFDRAVRHAAGEPVPREMTERMWRHFDPGTQRALLRLHRSATPEALARFDAGVRRIHRAALVLCGAADPYLSSETGDAYGARLARGRVEVLPGAGHWLWIERPEVVERVSRFLREGA